jgi:hypothetical protein
MNLVLIQLNKDQAEFVDYARKLLSKAQSRKVKKSEVIMMILNLGYPAFKQDIDRLAKKVNNISVIKKKHLTLINSH